MNQSGPKTSSGNLVSSYEETKTFVGTQVQIWSYYFDSVGVRFTKPDVSCGAMGEMVGRTALAKCRQNIMHVLRTSFAQAFVFKLREKGFKLKTLYSRKL